MTWHFSWGATRYSPTLNQNNYNGKSKCKLLSWFVQHFCIYIIHHNLKMWLVNMLTLYFIVLFAYISCGNTSHFLLISISPTVCSIFYIFVSLSLIPQCCKISFQMSVSYLLVDILPLRWWISTFINNYWSKMWKYSLIYHYICTAKFSVAPWMLSVEIFP